MIVLVGAAAFAAQIVLFSFSLYRLAIQRNRKPFLATDPNMPKVEDERIRQIGEWFRSQPFEPVEIASEEGLKLRGQYLEPEEPSDRAIVLAHGYSGKGEDMAYFAKEYKERGFRVLMPDNRGHGQSEGAYIGFGWHDRRDYAAWIDYLIRRIGPQAQIVLHGVSMGGATVLMTAGEPLPEQVKCVISDCAYSSAVGILAYQLRQMFRLPPFPLLPLTSMICKLRAGFFFGEASAVRQLRQSRLPILLIHGGDDTYVPTAMAAEIYDAIPGDKERLIVPGAQHGMSILTDPEAYWETVMGFLRKYLNHGAAAFPAREPVQRGAPLSAWVPAWSGPPTLRKE
ncbi:alpha/beta fold hydrolase [Cohnella sp. CBP 2801]|uniref:Alpha/beta fold hydrolase n=2 Tax=Cohnella zeiphila TaxID=2761120 RepID=A0A7X0SNE7_9BACL|nr:alpha/beta fold hydrolase [Cohnella zeiphila]